MDSILVFMVIAPLVAGFMGFLQIRSAGFNHFTVMLTVVLIAAYQSVMIGLNKDGNFLEGMAGLMVGGTMALAALGLILGGAIAWVSPQAEGGALGWAGKLAMTLATCLVAVIAVIASLMEPGTPAPPL